MVHHSSVSALERVVSDETELTPPGMGSERASQRVPVSTASQSKILAIRREGNLPGVMHFPDFLDIDTTGIP